MIAYPDHNIDPSLKGKDWIMQYGKAFWNDWEATVPHQGIFAKKAIRYEDIQAYALGEPPISKYKKILLDDDKAEDSWMKIDWTPRPIWLKFMDIAISKLMQREYNIVATPVDALAKTEQDKYFADAKARILMQEVLKKSNPELLQSPAMATEPGEPADLEELKMKMDYGFKFNLSMEAEMGIELIFQQNEIEKKRKQILEYLFKFGVAGVKDEQDYNDQIVFRVPNPRNVLSGYCRQPDFSDSTHFGEAESVKLSELANYFNKEELEEISRKAMMGGVESPAMPTMSYNYQHVDKFHAIVFKFQFISWNTKVRRQIVNKEGNLVFKPADYSNKNDKSKIVIGDKESDKYLTKDKQVVYEGKWVVGTDYIYDFGLTKNMKLDTSPKTKGCAELDFHFYAPNFHEMRASGIFERLIPIIDDYLLTGYKLQNTILRLVPNGWFIDLDAIEGLALGKGGKPMGKKEVLDFFFQTGILPGRTQTQMAGNNNYRPIIPIENNSSANEIVSLFNHLAYCLQDMREVTGLNELTDGSTPNAKTLVPVAKMAYESTNNSLYQIATAERFLLQKLATSVFKRAQTVLRSGGDVSGYVRSLGSGSVKFVQLSKDLALRDFGIFIHDKPTDQEKQMLLDKMNLKDSQGLIDPDDWVTIMNIQNLKQAEQYLAYKVKKRREEQQNFELQKIQQGAQANAQVAQQAEAMKQETIKLQAQLDLQIVNAKGQWDYKIAMLKAHTAIQTSRDSAESKVVSAGIAGETSHKNKKIDQGMDPGSDSIMNDLTAGSGPEEQGEPQPEPQTESQEAMV